MITAKNAKLNMIANRKKLVESKIYAAIEDGYVGVTVQKDLVSLELKTELEILGFEIKFTPSSTVADDGFTIKWGNANE